MKLMNTRAGQFVRKAAIITVFAGIALLTTGIFTSCKTAKLPGTCNNDKEFRQDNGDDIRKGGTCGSGAKDYRYLPT